MTEKMVLQQTRQAYLGVLAGMSYVKALQQALQSSEKALRATNAGFEVGTRTAIEVLDAQRELFRGQRDFASARYEYLLNTLRLKSAVGLLSNDDLEQINNWLE
jgi:outer membrane protein